MAVAEERQRAGPDHGNGSVLGDDGQFQRLPADRLPLPDRVQKREVRVETAERDVLSVVRRRIRVAFASREGLHSPTQGWTRLQQRHLMPVVEKPKRGREPGQAAADNDELHSKATAFTLPTAESRGRSVKTS